MLSCTCKYVRVCVYVFVMVSVDVLVRNHDSDQTLDQCLRNTADNVLNAIFWSSLIMGKIAKTILKVAAI